MRKKNPNGIHLEISCDVDEEKCVEEYTCAYAENQAKLK